ncbi:cytochrome oxidase assembly protein-domain-containing protein [Mycena belliarum]|uniref:Cytochrome oxidase assembly protein-domain-containing protein n=1 Tax=Mycena belliarum TaxID=1033014 RepID=A0AAD6UEZ7_9AGAR|nr:cytochrome oxidase assembly protein-domain-containing protein [Mycena belliae]
MLLAALKRASLQSPFRPLGAGHFLRRCSQPHPGVGLRIRPRIFLRFASVKSDAPPLPKAPKKSRKLAEKHSVAEKSSKVSRSPVTKSIPPAIEKETPALVAKTASVLAKSAPKNVASLVAKATPGTKSPPQVTPAGINSVLRASVPPSIEPGNPSVAPRKIGKPMAEVETESVAASPPPPPAVGIWLMISSVLVLVVVVVGGITRLTESGLSITEWRPITGVLPPLSSDAWEVEFSKYKLTPEYKMLNHSCSLDDFKRIYIMEWTHRILGRLIGIVFVGPLAYFTITRKISNPLALRLGGLGLLIGAQGALGWYMVQSGMEDALLETPGAVPRVSHYRLAAHLAMAFALYTGMFSTGMAIMKDWRFARTGMSSGLPAASFTAALKNPLVKRFKSYSWALTGLVLLTALSGVFVAGLDAGLIYNEWPLMGGRLAPPTDELFSPAYAQSESKLDLWRNIFENPTTVQFDHRLLATTTYIGTALLFAQTFRPALRSVIPPLVLTSTRAAFAMANVQVLLGISTLLYLVPVPLAAAHQAGSILLLSSMLQLLIALRRPSTAARAWRNVTTAKATKATKSTSRST